MIHLLWLACAPAPPPSVDPEAGLALLLDGRGDRHVALGEIEHGSGVIAEVRADWTRALIDDGARVLAIEGPWSGGRRIQAWLDADCEGATSLEISTHLAHKAFTDVTTAELLDWICVHNRVHSDDLVRVVGFDSQDPGALELAADRLGRSDLGRLCLGGTVDPECAALLASPEVPELAQIAVNAFSAQLVASGLDAAVVRDEAMAELLRRQLDAPAVIWAHTVHLNEASEQTRTCWEGFASMVCRRLGVRGMGTWLVDLDIVTVALTGPDLELWLPETPRRRRAGYRTAEAVLPTPAYVPLDAPWVATVGRTRGDLSAAFDAILTVAPGRSVLPAQTLEALGQGEAVHWTTALAPEQAVAVAKRALATGPWAAAVSTTDREGWTQVLLTP